MDERLLPLLRLLFEAPTEREARTPFFEALGAAFSPDVRAVTLVERTLPSTTLVLFGAGFENVVAGALPPGRRGPGGGSIGFRWAACSRSRAYPRPSDTNR